MNIESFEFRKQESYASFRPGEMIGKVKLSGTTGSQEIILSNAAMVQVFIAIRADLISTSKRNAEMTTRAVDEAINGPLLNTATQVPELA